MKVYMFYQSIDDLTPVLYGFTSDKLRASIFKLYRPSLYQIIKDVSKSDYNEMRDKLHGKEIIPHEFISSVEHFGKMKVSQVATENEILNIILHKEELVLRELNRYALPVELFSKGIKHSLKQIHMDEVYRYYEEVVVLPQDSMKKIDIDFKIDELGLFLQLYGYTMEEKKKRRET